MEPFNLEKAIEGRIKTLWKQQGLEPGFIEEIEANLRDRIDEYLEKGYGEEDAFILATEKSIVSPEEIADEYFIARSDGKKTPPWKSRSVLSMMPSNFKVSWRNLRKRKIYSIINISGLAISFAISFLLWLYISDQLSYDQHLVDSQRVYRVNYDLTFDGQNSVYSNVAQPIGPTLKEEFPEIEEVIRFYKRGSDHSAEFIHEDVQVKSNKVFYAEASFLKVFKIKMTAGNPDEALAEPNSIVISEALANKLFSTTEVIGETLKVGHDASRVFKITGVIKDHIRTHLPVEALISATIPNRTDENRWLGGHVYTYVLLNDLNDIDGLKQKIPAFCQKHLKGFFEKKDAKANLLLQPLESIYLDEEHIWELYPHGSRTNVQAMVVMMLFLIVIACINYVNLATASSAERMKEVGIRKVLGSSKHLLIGQFISESVLLALISGFLGIAFSIVLLPLFNELSGLHMSIETILTLPNATGILLLSLIIGFLSGAYPAFYLVSFESSNALKGKLGKGRSSNRFRTLLMISQYSLSSILVIGMLFVGQQTRFIMNKEIGYNKTNLLSLSIPNDPVINDKLEVFMNSLGNKSSLAGVTSSYNSLSEEANANDPVFETLDGQTINTSMNRIDVDVDFIKTIEGTIIMGRDFEKSRGESEYRTVLLNEAAVKKYGWEDIATSLKLRSRDRDENGDYYYQDVIGVVSDFSIGPSYQKVAPLMINLNEWGVNNIYVRIRENEVLNGIDQVESAWKETFPNYAFDFSFLDQELKSIYARENRFLDLLRVVSFLIIFITSLGIIGLISFTIEMKRKEIAIRKVNGASISKILVLLSRKFISLLVIANCIAAPIAFYFVKQWLFNYDQHVDLTPWPFFLSTAICLAFTSLALTYHLLQAATTNPVESLRNE